MTPPSRFRQVGQVVRGVIIGTLLAGALLRLIHLEFLRSLADRMFRYEGF